MFYPLFFPFADQFQAFNLFRYITFRSGGAAVTALLISFLLGPHLIAWLRSKQANGQPIRPDGPNGHIERKKGTPTMGGFLILLALTISTLLWADLTNAYVWVVLFVMVAALWWVLSKIGVFHSIEGSVSNLTSGKDSAGVQASNWFSASRVLGYTMLVGAINVILITALATVGSVVYNLVTHVAGGIEVTLKETD